MAMAEQGHWLEGFMLSYRLGFCFVSCLLSLCFSSLVQSSPVKFELCFVMSSVQSPLCTLFELTKAASVDPHVALQLKDLDLTLKKQEHETQLLCLRALEIKADHDIKLLKLEL